MPKKTSDFIENKPFDSDQIKPVLELMFQRMDRLERHCQGGFPVFSPKADDQWLISKGGSWLGGFWAGLWWLRAKITQAGSDRDKALTLCRRLSAKLNEDSINRSLIFWYGAGLGELWFDDSDANELVIEAIDALSDTYNPIMDCMPLGTAMGGGQDGKQHINVDSLAALIRLFDRSQQDEHDCLLQRHVDTLSHVLKTQSGAFHAHARFGDGTYQTLGLAGDWSRGQAWAMLGLSRAAARWGEPYLADALKACEYWRHSRLQAIPPNRLSRPEGPEDPSSAVIAALAMLSLAESVRDGEQWRSDARRQISAIIHSPYFIGPDGNHETSGIFWGCCYKANTEEELVESVWGSFLLMAALSVLLGVIEPDQC